VANPIGQVIQAIAGLIILQISYVLFGPMIDGTLSNLVYDTINAPGPMGYLDANSGSLILTVKIILMGWKIFAFFIIFGILSRFFIYLGFLTEEEPVY
jgi:hypothetical protein